MTPVAPRALHEGARLVVFAEDQPQYRPLIASVGPDGLVMTEWEPSIEDLALLHAGGRVRIWIYTFGAPLQPLNVEVGEGQLPDGRS
jgi:hypothetical protein